MTENLIVFSSNRLEYLFTQFKKLLFLPDSGAFTRRIVIVPSQALRQWLQRALANEQGLGIAAAYESYLLTEAMEQLSLKQANMFFPSHQELAFSLQRLIHLILYSEKSKEALWKPLAEYLRDESGLVPFCDYLANLFLQYGRYGGNLLKEWLATEAEDWQVALWKILYNEQGWTYEYRLLDNITPVDPVIHLFGINALSPLQHAFFSKLAQSTHVIYYHFSPCRMYWGDTKTDGERKGIRAFWDRKGIREEQKQEVDAYLRDTNALLANFGRLGRHFLELLEETETAREECFFVHSDTIISELDGVILEKSSTPATLLDAIQSDILLLKSAKTEVQDFATYDATVQVHIASSQSREVEILYHELVARQCLAKDVIVMAPNIMHYEPYIHAVFGAEDSLLNYHLSDLQEKTQNPLIQDFLYLISLHTSRWDVSSILRLFDSKAFQEQHSIDEENLQAIRIWIKDTGIRWGQDPSHRNELLQKDYSDKSMLDDGGSATWDFGLTRLIYGLSIVLNQGERSRYCPYEGIEISQGELLGKLVFILRSLRDDLRPLGENCLLTPSEWCDYLLCLFDAYFSVNTRDEISVLHKAQLFKELNNLKQLSLGLSNEPFPFETIEFHLKKRLEMETAQSSQKSLNSVTFCSMLPMRAIPSNIICLMGMDAETFPRNDVNRSLNKLLGNDLVDYSPSRLDYDRYLFLEAILSCRQSLIMTYQSLCEQDQKEQEPSLLLGEVLNYMDSAYSINGALVSDLCVIKHPPYSFHYSYFSQRIKGPTQKKFRLAKAYYSPQRKETSRFIPEFYKGTKVADENQVLDIVALRDLSRTARDPVQSYCQKTLSMYLEQEGENRFEYDESFLLSALDTAFLRREAIKTPVYHVLKHAEMEGRLPLKPFKTLSQIKIMDADREQKISLDKLHILPEEITAIDCSLSVSSKRILGDGTILLPPLSLILSHSNREILLTGRLEFLSPIGLIIDAKDGLVNAIKSWPQFLLAALLQEPCDLIFLQGAKIKQGNFNILENLEYFIDYHMRCLHYPSPIIPEWVLPVYQKDEKALAIAMEKTFTNRFGFLSPYLSRTVSLHDLPSAALIIEEWQPLVEKAFATLIEGWYANEK